MGLCTTEKRLDPIPEEAAVRFAIGSAEGDRHMSDLVDLVGNDSFLKGLYGFGLRTFDRSFEAAHEGHSFSTRLDASVFERHGRTNAAEFARLIESD
jgi:hypothetical protein